jgi:ABC-type phosphate transport system substrate-binding protein
MRALLLAVAVLLLVPPAATAQRQPITMSGAVIATSLTADLAYFYRRAVSSPPRFEIVGGRTATGIADVSRGVSDVGLTARPLLPSDPSGLVFTPIARTGVCLVTNQANPVPGFSRAQVQDLVAARVTSWPQVSGSPLADPIVAGGVTVGAGTRTAFETVMLDPGTPQLNAPRTFLSSPQLRDFIRATPSAWGTSTWPLPAVCTWSPSTGSRARGRRWRPAPTRP